MDGWFDHIVLSAALGGEAAAQLREAGFTIIPGPVGRAGIGAFADAYDAAMADPSPYGGRVGSTSVRVNGFAARGAVFDPICVHPPLLSAAALVIGEPFRLSSMHGRTLLPHRAAPPLHRDCAWDDPAAPILSFILMVDDFTDDNGATRFLPGSHRAPPNGPEANIVAATGRAGSLIVYNGLVLHEHGANRTDRPRRSIQGAFVRRSRPAANPVSLDDALARRLSPLARYLLDPD